jgi:hypothetical protein
LYNKSLILTVDVAKRKMRRTQWRRDSRFWIIRGFWNWKFS